MSQQEPLAPYTKYRLGGPANWFVRPQSIRQLGELIARCHQEEIPCRILGGGANLLVADDGVEGVVVHLHAPCFTKIEWASGTRSAWGPGRESPPVSVTVGAGADMARLVAESVRRGLRGLEGLAGIPGSLGGVIRMNAGGRWGQISDVVREVTVVEPYGRLRTLSREEVGFSYRRTNLNGAVVCEARLALTPSDPQQLQERYRAVWSDKQAAQPLNARSAGCVFKNPPGQSAGRLIDRAGLKDRSIGCATVSREHANFIVAREGGTAGDVLALIGLVRRTVAERFGVELELEIEIWDRRCPSGT